MKKIDSVKVVALIILLLTVIVSGYLYLVMAKPQSAELQGISTGIEPLPDISFSSPAFTELEVRQRFGPVPLQVGGSDVGRTQPFSEP